MAHDSFRAIVTSTVICEEVYIFQEEVNYTLAGVCVSATKMYTFFAGISLQYFILCENSVQSSPGVLPGSRRGRISPQEFLSNIGIILTVATSIKTQSPRTEKYK